MAQDSKPITGQCLCGRVSYQVTGPLGPVLQCHCENCRRISGNYVAACRTPSEALVVSDEHSQLDWHTFPYAKYGFCRGCGSTLFFHPVEPGDVTSVMVGTLDDGSDLVLDSVWFANDAQPHNTLPEGVPLYQGNET